MEKPGLLYCCTVPPPARQRGNRFRGCGQRRYRRTQEWGVVLVLRQGEQWQQL